MRTGRSWALAVLAALAALLPAMPAPAADSVQLQLDWIPTGEYAAFFAGWQKGFWQEQGIDIVLTRGYGSGDTVAKLAAGSADFGIADLAAILTARARTGTPVKAVGAVYTRAPQALFVLAESGIRSLGDLEGRRIGLTPGNSHRLYFPAIAARAGIDPDKVVWVSTDASAMAAMLLAGRIDAAPFYVIHHAAQNRAALAAGKQILMLPFEQAGSPTYGAAFATTDRTIRDKPDLVRRFLAGAYRSFRWAGENRKEACDLHVKRNPDVGFDDCADGLAATLSLVLNAESETAGLGRFDPERLKASWEAIAEAQGLPPGWDYGQAVDTALLPPQ